MDFSSFSLIHIEDDQIEIDLIKRVLDDIDFNGKYQHFFCGEDLFDFLEENRSEKPQFILLDIGLPGLGGKDILRKLKTFDRTKSVPVVMLSGSNSERDLHESLSLGCNGYIIKSSEFADYRDALKYTMYSWALLGRQEFI